ncbi:MAG TPA: class I SAM-dependent methyltransferase [Thermoleophilaceae bacterium]|nr:class I SAM-dependent methyltransferase [Thermoleophilaceae bacterium]
MATAAIDEARLEEFVGRVVTDMSAAMSAPLTLLGVKLGLYEGMKGAGPLSSAEVAEKAGCDERLVREWLANQVAGGYVEYDAEGDRYELPAEHAMVFAEPDSPVYLMGGFDIMASVWADEEKFVEAFRTGGGMGWHEHDHRLFHGTEKFFRPGYQAHLTAEWIPALDGVEGRLQEGIRVADVGCGHGASTVIMAREYPNSEFVGFDYHDESIARARELAEAEGLGDRVSFEVASAQDFPGKFDLVCNFDCLHDMGDPVGAAKHTAEALNPGGTYFIVEPNGGDNLTDNVNPVGRMFYGASTLICTPASQSQDVGLALGAQAGFERLSEVLKEGGFAQVRKATETPFNIILEARA